MKNPTKGTKEKMRKGIGIEMKGEKRTDKKCRNEV